MIKSDELIKQWLEIDYNVISRKAQFRNEEVIVTDKLIYSTIRYLDHETAMSSSPDINIIISLIALMWEHADRKKYNLKDIIVKFLTKVGYPTSAIICDKNFDNKRGLFSPALSRVDEIELSIRQACNEVTLGEEIFLLTDFQKEIWLSMEKERIIGISAPTSAGKSFVILLKLVKLLTEEEIDVVYIVPTLSLVNQVTEDFNKMLKRAQCKDCIILNSYEQEKYIQKNRIYILTQEKAIAAFSNSNKAFEKPLVLVADEIQNIERIVSDEDERAKILYDTLVEFRHNKNVRQIIISGPRINNIEKVGKSIFGNKADSHKTDISPVLNITYSINKVGKKYYFKQYSNLNDEPIVREIDNANVIAGYGRKTYSDEYLGYFQNFITNTGGEQNIIFAPTSSAARKIAVSIDSYEKCNEYENNLIEYYRSTVHERYALCNTIEKGVAYHHGKLPMHVRRTLEKAIAEKRIKNVVCTTTLLQGVNLPAQNVYIRNPHLYVKRLMNSSELTSYEMANLRGRAGRLMKDFVGRTFVMDESEFSELDDYQQETLFENTTKELPSNYEQKFEEFREEIENALNTNAVVGSDMKQYGYLVSYIRQTIFRYGLKSRTRMKEVGISFTKEQIAAMYAKLQNISVPKGVCEQNRYWDPLVLDYIYQKFQGEIPNTPYDKNIRKNIDSMMHFLRDNQETKYMYERYIPESYRDGKGRGILVSNALKWSKGNKLSEILSGKRFEGEDAEEKIEETIELLQTTISFRLPLLLKPFYDIINSDSSFLTSMQTGACDAITRNLIEMGIPRETAIYLYENCFDLKDQVVENTEDIDKKIHKVLEKNYKDLPYWIKVQLDYLI